MSASNHHDLLIVGGGISGTALLFAAARYSNLKRIALLEKCASLASVNSSAQHNSQTLHCGDIETNYTLDKALHVKRAADMLVKYGTLVEETDTFLFKFPKMVLAVGEAEISRLRTRFDQFAAHYPGMRWLDGKGVAEVEPHVAQNADGTGPRQVAACAILEQYCAVNFATMATSFARHASAQGKDIRMHLGTRARDILPQDGGFEIHTDRGIHFAKAVVVCAGGHSLLFAQRMGYGLDLSVLPVAGSFYFAPQVLRGKVYTIQNDKLPFAAIHGDPDILVPGRTRFGPTALVLPMLERYAASSIVDYFRVANIDSHVVKVIARLLKDSDIRRYIGKNVLFDVPILRRHLFLKDAQKIVPSLRLDDLRFAQHTGGIRPQLIDKRNEQLLLGEGKINPGNGIVFNMTPSPGATSCLANAERDLLTITEHLGASFDRQHFARELAS
jgi:malate dehydrogenase (quinone)